MRRHRIPHPEPGEPGHEEYLAGRRSLRIRRSIGVLVVLAMIYGLVWLVFFSHIADPILEQARPAVAFVKKVKEDPQKAWYAVAGFVMLHMGMLAFIFDDRNR